MMIHTHTELSNMPPCYVILPYFLFYMVEFEKKGEEVNIGIHIAPATLKSDNLATFSLQDMAFRFNIFFQKKKQTRSQPDEARHNLNLVAEVTL